jgi:hypothetical protein
VPIAIILVCLGTFFYVSFNVAKLINQQAKLRIKRKTFLKTHQLQDYKHKMSKPRYQKAQLNLNTTHGAIIASTLDTNTMEDIFEASMERTQNNDQNLNRMCIIDLFCYILFLFPYTVLRLVLDLFVKDRIKINLDFFILYNLCLLMFHISLIGKFFILLIFNIQFRKSFARAFSFEPAYCCIDDMDEDEAAHSSKIINENFVETKESCLYFVFCCFLCRNCLLSQLFADFGILKHGGAYDSQANDSLVKSRNDFYAEKQQQRQKDRKTPIIIAKKQTSPNDFMEIYQQTDADDNQLSRDHSMEFNTMYHQFLCPANPDDDTIV